MYLQRRDEGTCDGQAFLVEEKDEDDWWDWECVGTCDEPYNCAAIGLACHCQ